MCVCVSRRSQPSIKRVHHLRRRELAPNSSIDPHLSSAESSFSAAGVMYPPPHPDGPFWHLPLDAFVCFVFRVVGHHPQSGVFAQEMQSCLWLH